MVMSSIRATLRFTDLFNEETLMKTISNRTKPARMMQRAITAAFIAGAVLSAPLANAAWPERLIRLIHPYAAGGPGDNLTRELAIGMQAELNQTVIADNRPGGGTLIGADLVAKSPPDGYTILMVGPATHVIMPAIHPKLPYNADRDFELIGMWAVVGNMISVHPSVPVKNLKELIDYAKKNPNKLNYSSGGVGSGPHLAGETFKMMTGTEIVHVPYKGAAPATAAIVAGEVQVTTVNIPPQAGFIRAGRLQPIAVTTSKRSSLLPDVPTAEELGLKGLVAESWYGLGVPRGTPQEVRDIIYRTMVKVGSQPERKARMAAAGAEVSLSTAAELAAYIKNQQDRLGPVLKKLDLKIDQ